MSRIGKQPVQIPKGIEINIQYNLITIKGPKGTLNYQFHPCISIEKKDDTLVILCKGNEREDRSLHGLTRALTQNMITGVLNGFKKELEIIGVGYRAQANGKKLTLNLGFSHPIDFLVPEGITIENNKENKNVITIYGIDKQLVGEVAANIRKYRPPEPYKGKGIRYMGEYVPRKAGKAAATAKE